MRTLRKLLLGWAGLALCVPFALAADAERGLMVREGTLYLSPDLSAQRIGSIGRGRELAVLERSKDFAHVIAQVEGNRSITGWTLAKGIILPSTPNAHQILFGEAADSEWQASKRGGRKNAAQDAMRLYFRLAEYFPKSPLAGEALWRAADIRWQLDKVDVQSRKSAKEQEAYLRGQIDEEWMKMVQKKFPDSKWAALAAYARLDNKVCGDWQGLPKCPEDEAELFEKYAREYPKSPKAAEAMHEAAWRYAALADIQKVRNEEKKSAEAKTKALSLARALVAQYPQEGDWAYRAQRLAYMLEQDIPVYGIANQ